MKNLISLLSLMILLIFSCETPRKPMDLGSESMIPRPTSLTASGSSFLLENGATIALNGNAALQTTAEILSKEIGVLTGLQTMVDVSAETGSIQLMVDQAISSSVEGYKLDIGEQSIVLTGATPEGVFRGIQTLLQLLPIGSETIDIASGIIEDQPRFGYRGAMLDVSRHFFSVEDVKQYIDYMSYFKMNYLHLHLTDDQGWRIEIKSWPKLTTVGGQTEVDGGKGGFYTQEEYKDIIAYAADRYITIIPEIDMPGHTHAILASYDELNCQPIAASIQDELNPDGLYTGREVGFSTLCANMEITYEFIDDVIRELSEMTPGPYIHIGGDESHVTELDDYLLFMNRVLEIVRTYEKKPIGWDELAQADIDDRAAVQLWNNLEFGELANSKGSKLIMSPAHLTYMDMKYDSTIELGYNWAAYIEVDDGYDWDPVDLSENIGEDGILGIEAPLWSETIDTMDEIEFLMFPRVMGYAEIGWSTRDRDWEEYRLRLADFTDQLEKRDINFYRSPFVDWR